MKKSVLLYFSASIIFLNGCSDLGFGSCGEDNCDGSDLISTITLNDFVGTWDGSRDIANEGRDENYMIVKPSGDVTYYDYQGDSYNLGNNCYISRSIKLTDSGILNSFTHPVTVDDVTKLESIKAELSGNNLSFTFAASSPTTPGRFDYTPSTMIESDFVPACTTE